MALRKGLTFKNIMVYMTTSKATPKKARWWWQYKMDSRRERRLGEKWEKEWQKMEGGQVNVE